MQVNNDIYGSPNTWHDIYPDVVPNKSDNAYSDVKVADFGYSASSKSWYITTGKANNRLPQDVNSFDKSIAIWGIGAKSAFAHMVGIYPASGGDTYTFDVQSSYDQMPLLLVTQADTNQYPEFYTDYNYKLSSAGDYYKCGFVTDFNYQSPIACCFITAASTNFLTDRSYKTITVSVYDYYHSPNNYHVNYPYVLEGRVIMYIYDSDSKTTRVNATPAFFVNGYRPFIDLSTYGDDTQYNTDYFRLLPNSYTGAQSTILTVFGNYTQRGGILDVAIGQTPEESFNTSSSTAYNTSLQLAYVDNDAKYIQKQRSDSNNYHVLCYWESPSETDILKKFAFLGFWFTDNNTADNINATLGTQCTNQHVYLPEFDDNGITTGNYWAGTDTQDKPNASWGSARDDINYNPDYEQAREDEDDNPVSNVLAPFSFESTTKYILTLRGIQDVRKAINAIPDYDTVSQKWYGLDPSDFVISLYYYPFALPQTGTPETVTIGQTVVTDTNGAELTAYKANDYIVMSLGDIAIQPYYNDFRDYAPYSTYTLYLPYIGTYNIDAAIFLNHVLSVNVAVDFNTHTAVVTILRDRFVYDYMQVQIGESLNLSAKDVGTYYNAIATAQSNLTYTKASAVLNTIANVAKGFSSTVDMSGSPLDLTMAFTNTASTLLTDAHSIKNQKFNIDNSAPTPVSVSNAGGAVNIYFDDIARLIVTHPYKVIDDALFAQQFGFACLEVGALLNYSGFTTATNIQFAPADGITAAEYSAITSAFAKGVILP